MHFFLNFEKGLGKLAAPYSPLRPCKNSFLKNLAKFKILIIKLCHSIMLALCLFLYKAIYASANQKQLPLIGTCIRRSFSIKSLFYKILPNSQENTCARVSFLVKAKSFRIQLYQKIDCSTSVFL